MTTLTCRVPWPPTMNSAWRSVAAGEVHRSKNYRKFIRDFNDSILEHKVRRHWTTARLAIALELHPPNARSYDIDNRVKCCLDALAGAGVIFNDAMVDILLVARAKVEPPGSVIVCIEEIGHEKFSSLQHFRDQFFSSTFAPPPLEEYSHGQLAR